MNTWGTPCRSMRRHDTRAQSLAGGKEAHPLDRAAAMLRGEDGIEDGPAAPRQLLKSEV